MEIEGNNINTLCFRINVDKAVFVSSRQKETLHEQTADNGL